MGNSRRTSSQNPNQKLTNRVSPYQRSLSSHSSSFLDYENDQKTKRTSSPKAEDITFQMELDDNDIINDQQYESEVPYLNLSKQRDQFLQSLPNSSTCQTLAPAIMLLIILSTLCFYTFSTTFSYNSSYVDQCSNITNHYNNLVIHYESELLTHILYTRSIEDTCNSQINGLILTICQMESVYNRAVQELTTRLGFLHFPYHNSTICQGPLSILSLN